MYIYFIHLNLKYILYTYFYCCVYMLFLIRILYTDSGTNKIYFCASFCILLNILLDQFELYNMESCFRKITIELLNLFFKKCFVWL